MRKRLTRGQVLPVLEKIAPCRVGIEACGWAYHWAREIQALGHEVRLMPAQYVKPYVKQNKTDAADAEAICEAVQRPTLRFVATKSIASVADGAVVGSTIISELASGKSVNEVLDFVASLANGAHSTHSS